MQEQYEKISQNQSQDNVSSTICFESYKVESGELNPEDKLSDDVHCEFILENEPLGKDWFQNIILNSFTTTHAAHNSSQAHLIENFKNPIKIYCTTESSIDKLSKLVDCLSIKSFSRVDLKKSPSRTLRKMRSIEINGHRVKHTGEAREIINDYITTASSCIKEHPECRSDCYIELRPIQLLLLHCKDIVQVNLEFSDEEITNWIKEIENLNPDHPKIF